VVVDSFMNKTSKIHFSREPKKLSKIIGREEVKS